MTPDQFAKRMNEIARNVEKNVNKAIVTATMRGFQELLTRTPVDKGVAVSNWRIGLNRSSTIPRKAYSPGKDGSTAESNASAAAVAASKVLARYKATDTIYISNAVPYMKRLNDGYSKQAPAGFVEASLSAIRARIRAAKIVIRL